MPYQILPPLLPDEFKSLKASIAERGVEVPQRVAEWEVRTGKKQATFYRRIKELRMDGRLPG